MHLPIEILSVAFLHVFASALFGLPPLLASDLFLLHSVGDEFVFEVVALVVELGVIFCDVVLVV